MPSTAPVTWRYTNASASAATACVTRTPTANSTTPSTPTRIDARTTNPSPLPATAARLAQRRADAETPVEEEERGESEVREEQDAGDHAKEETDAFQESEHDREGNPCSRTVAVGRRARRVRCVRRECEREPRETDARDGAHDDRDDLEQEPLRHGMKGDTAADRARRLREDRDGRHGQQRRRVRTEGAGAVRQRGDGVDPYRLLRRLAGAGHASGDVYGRSRGWAADRFGIITLRRK